jgi:hypothetical protein
LGKLEPDTHGFSPQRQPFNNQYSRKKASLFMSLTRLLQLLLHLNSQQIIVIAICFAVLFFISGVVFETIRDIQKILWNVVIVEGWGVLIWAFAILLILRRLVDLGIIYHS